MDPGIGETWSISNQSGGRDLVRILSGDPAFTLVRILPDGPELRLRTAVFTQRLRGAKPEPTGSITRSRARYATPPITKVEQRSASSLVKVHKARAGVREEWVEAARLARSGMTHKEIGERFGVGKHTISQWVAAVREEGLLG